MRESSLQAPSLSSLSRKAHAFTTELRTTKRNRRAVLSMRKPTLTTTSKKKKSDTNAFKTVASKTVSRSELFGDDDDANKTTTSEIKSMRIADVLVRVFTERFPTKTAAKKSIRRGEVTVNEAKTEVEFEVLKEWFESKKEGEEEEATITIEIQARMNANFGAGDVASSSRGGARFDDMPKEIREGDNATTVAYEDEECVIVRKSFGIPTLKTKMSGNAASSKNSNNNSSNSELEGWSLDRVLPYIAAPAVNVEGALHRPRPVHRLDSLTGGLVVCAKTRRALKVLSEAFRDRTARKRYRAVLIEYTNAHGGLGKRKINEKRGTITSNDMGPKRNQYAETEFTICDETGEDDENTVTKVLIDFHPKTGRTHQLRKHAEKELNMPILGDDRYGGKAHCDNAKNYRPKLHLFAAEITLPPEAVPWRNDAGGEGGGEPLNVRVSEPAFFRKSMDASDVWNASTFVATD